ncbi:MAG: hypothetical protein SGARI_005209, partial [Bacillariaceae sp.]
MCMLGEKYMYGDEVEQDAEQAAHWLRKASEEGDEEAASLLRHFDLHCSKYLKDLEPHIVAIAVTVLVSSEDTVRVKCVKDLVSAVGGMLQELNDVNVLAQGSSEDAAESLEDLPEGLEDSQPEGDSEETCWTFLIRLFHFN